MLAMLFPMAEWRCVPLARAGLLASALLLLSSARAPAAPYGVLSELKHSAAPGSTFDGDLATDVRLGAGIATLGDLDNDGTVDVAVGVANIDDGGPDRGGFWILFMNANGTVKAKTLISDTQGGFTGGLSDSDRFGLALESLDDVNGDGVEDLAVGVELDDDGGNDRGAVWMLYLTAAGTVSGQKKLSSATVPALASALDNNDRFGSSIARIGDLDGDGIEELAVGAYLDDDGGGNRGAVYILFLDASENVTAIQKIKSGDGMLALEDGGQFGVSVAPVGDFDGDLIPDIAVSANTEDSGGTNRGAVYLVFLNADGSAKGHQRIAPGGAGGFYGQIDNHDSFGNTIAAGDVDGDGVIDLTVAANTDDDGGNNRGAVWVLFLQADGTVREHLKISSTSGGLTGPLDDGDEFGSRHDNLGDLDGNGTMDLMVGASLDDDGGTPPGANLGAAYVLFLWGCGNGALEPAEQCDDGNRTPGDGCSATCKLEGQENCAEKPAGLQAWWRGEDDFQDSEGGPGGAPSHSGGGVAPGFTLGMVGNAFEFVDAGQQIDIDDTLDLSGDFTFDLWFRLDSLPGAGEQMQLFDKRESNDVPGAGFHEVEVYVKENGSGLLFQTNNTTGPPGNPSAVTKVEPAFTLTAGDFYFLAAVREGATLRLYVNGVEIDSASGAGVVDVETDGDLRLGRNSNDGHTAGTLLGVIDEVEFFNRALTPTEITSLFEAQSAGKCRCGDARVTAGECCDFGVQNGQPGSGCSAICGCLGECTISREECGDESECPTGQGCCGNGVVEGPPDDDEQCDDGNLLDGDTCTSACQNDLGGVPPCPGVFGRHILPAAMKAKFKDRDGNYSDYESWSVGKGKAGDFNLFPGQEISPCTEPTLVRLQENDGAGGVRVLGEFALQPADWTTCLERPAGSGDDLAKFKDAFELVSEPDGLRTALIKEKANKVKYKFKGSREAEILRPLVVPATAKVRVCVYMGDEVGTTVLTCEAKGCSSSGDPADCKLLKCES